MAELKFALTIHELTTAAWNYVTRDRMCGVQPGNYTVGLAFQGDGADTICIVTATFDGSSAVSIPAPPSEKERKPFLWFWQREKKAPAPSGLESGSEHPAKHEQSQ